MPTDFDIIHRMAPIELSRMDSIRLMNRVDTKYLTDAGTLDDVLTKAAGRGYMVLEMSGRRIQDYRTMYYDTPSLQMYLDHHNGRLVRQKLRTRCYGTTGRTFLELKSKDNHGRTRKGRVEIDPRLYGAPSLVSDDTASAWLDGKMTYSGAGMSPSLETVFSRITLVNPEMTERATVDFDIRFNNVRGGASADMGHLAIVELKQDCNLHSTLSDILLECRVKRMRISKYCIGTAMTDTAAKSGNFKQKMISINKMKENI